MTLREHRIAAGLSQSAVARILGVTQGSWHNWEMGHRHVPNWVVNGLRSRLNWDVEYTGQKGAPQPKRATTPQRTLWDWDAEPKTDRHLRLARQTRNEKQYMAGLVVMCCRPLREVDRLLGVEQTRRAAV